MQNELQTKWNSKISHGLRIAGLAALGLFAACCGPKSAAAGPQIGINLSFTQDWDGQQLFADAMKESRGWEASVSNGAYIPANQLDANGWPQQDAFIYTWAGQPTNNSGQYAMSFNGQATLSVTTDGSATITNQTYNSGTNTTTATLTNSSATAVIELGFTNTKRTSGSATNTGITNVKLMRPITPGGATDYATNVTFTTPAKNLYAKFQVLRMMDFSSTNGNPTATWSQRKKPTWFSQSYGWVPSYSVGSAWEYAVQLCNETNKDLWVNVPISANDDYITKLAQLIQFGSDGSNPYTSTQGSPVWAPLNAGLKVYIEYSNEVWNTGFQQALDNHTAAVNEVNAGGSPLNFDGGTNDWDWAAHRSAKRTVEISNIFRTVFGSAAMMTRVRPVLESQEDFTSFWLMGQAHMLEDYYNNPSKVATPHPPSYYIYGGGGAAYYNPDDNSDSLTLSNIWTSLSFDPAYFATHQQSDGDYGLSLYGRHIAYEGGPSLDNFGHSEAVKAQAWGDNRMTGIITSHQTAWNQTGGDLLVYFDAVGDYQWGFTHDVNVLNSPKLIGIDQVNTSTQAAGTYGITVPATIPAGNYLAPPTWAGANPSNMVANGNWTWTEYTVHNSSAAALTIGLSAGSAGTGNQADVYVDGVLAGTIAIPNTGSNGTFTASPTVTSASLPAGSHGILIKAKAGSFGFTSLTITGGSPPPLPGTPGALTATSGTSLVSLSWGAATNAATYNIYRATTSGGEALIASGIGATSYTDTGLTGGTTYFYKVAGVNATGTGPQSNEASATPTAAQQAQLPNGTPVIDGNNTDTVWASAASNNITHISGTISSSADLSATWKGAWDATNLYVLVDVTDDVKINDSVNVYDDDAVEVYLDADHNGGTGYDANDCQIEFGWGDAAAVEGGGRAIAGVTFAKADPSGTTYRIEAKIPWAVEAFTPTNNAVIGVDVHVTDDDDGGARDGKLMWNDTSDQAWSNPSLFGTGTLLPAGGSAPPAPTGLTATAGNTQVALSWTASTGATAYDVKRSTVSGSGYATVSSPATTSYTNTGLTNGTTYYFVVDAKNASGTSANSSQASATPSAGGGGGLVKINAGGPAAAPFVADIDFSGGLTATNWTGAIDTSAVVSPAPQTVYQSERYGAMTYTMGGLTSGTTYQVRLHFCENYFTANAQRTFTVAINGTAVLTNFDIFATAGAIHKANIQQFNATANGSGQVVVTFTNVVNNALINGIEVNAAGGSAGTPVNLSSSFNLNGIYNDGVSFATGGMDGSGFALSGTLLGTSQTWSSTSFTIGTAGALDVVSGGGQTITLPGGAFTNLKMLATAVGGNQTSQGFTVTYTDNSTSTFTQSLSDWFSPQSYAGETNAIPMAYRNQSNGTKDNRTFYVYGYSFTLNGAKTVKNVILPNNGSVKILALTLK